MEYTTSLLWLLTWPLIIFLGYKFTAFNLKYFRELEKLEEDQ
ncbi:hypothetical protein PGH07_06430 [Sulfurovum sp. zt1-1]|uniref:Uncharacterized protein n=1 Tax=Sulfurovum zhangzhouensis TaxID=3019067 RepID=A0ABT7QYD8_9BACT|nr:hypothetical protein [Sulfurovum zhangzhouensis]MDM5271807.1 hypothetical protein [Sulfurovum zhangzhouensis]